MGNWTEEDVAEYHRRVIGGGNTAPPPMPAAKGRLPKPEMNKTEAAYSAHLDLQQKAGVVAWHKFEAIKVRIGEHCWLSPDFLILYPDGRLELHDTKGTKRNKEKGTTSAYAEDDAIVKARVVGEFYPIPIYFVWREKNGEWSRREM